MKAWSLLVFLFFCHSLLAGASSVSSNEVVISIITFQKSPHRSELKLTLKKTGTELKCVTDHIPEHTVVVRNLISLDSPPFKNQSHVENCEKILTWSSAKTCYLPGQYPVVDNIIQRCLNI